MKIRLPHPVVLLGLLLAVAGPLLAADAKLMITMMPKAKGNAYFISVKAGADKAAKELSSLGFTESTQH